ncbi:MAG TPA: ATP-binding protein [Bryobacteraceae bacterium]|nr:ATP-binding protein [Bryobacteraceae bacterium]
MLLPVTRHVSRLCYSLMRVVLLVGLPGSGKSTWLEQIGAGALSSDTVRRWLADDETDQTIHDRVFQTMRYLLRHRLQLGRPVTYIDATNLTPAERQPYIGIGRSYGCEVEAVYFDVPLAVCRERNARRHRVVPEEALEKMAARLVPPSEAEGFDRVARLGETGATAMRP